MDEPTTALDVVIQREILDELIELRRRLGFSVVFITHDLSLLVEIADTIAVMYAGRSSSADPRRALFESPRHPYTRGLVDSFPACTAPRRTDERYPRFAARPARTCPSDAPSTRAVRSPWTSVGPAAPPVCRVGLAGSARSGRVLAARRRARRTHGCLRTHTRRKAQAPA